MKKKWHDITGPQGLVKLSLLGLVAATMAVVGSNQPLQEVLAVMPTMTALTTFIWSVENL